MASFQIQHAILREESVRSSLSRVEPIDGGFGVSCKITSMVSVLSSVAPMSGFVRRRGSRFIQSLLKEMGPDELDPRRF